MFPLSLSSELTVFSKDFAFFEQNFNAEINNAFRNETSLEFRNTNEGFSIIGAYGRFAWKGFHLLNGISETKIQLKKQKDKIKISYHLVFKEALYIALLFSIIPIFTSPHLKLILKSEEYNVQILLFIIIWLILYLGNMFISFIRFHVFLRRKIKKILDKERNYILDRQLEKIKTLNNEIEQKI